ncbi:MAG TPA: carboxypeptidase regulatory-like domain-containing protein [Planctomycetota bacterium]|nr:carboxypeptidase regulatory-like domain-containing protein [Planctomycetota bacterium]
MKPVVLVVAALLVLAALLAWSFGSGAAPQDERPWATVASAPARAIASRVDVPATAIETAEPRRAATQPLEVAAKAAPQAETATIRGKVVDATNGEPIANAGVAAWPATGPAKRTRSVGNAKTAADGTFELAGLAAGSLHLIATSASHAHGERGPVEAVVGEVVEVEAIVVSRGGAIEGVALARDGKPMAGGSASVVRNDRSDAAPGFLDKDATIDESGAFRIEGLAAGTWSVSAVPAGFDAYADLAKRISTKAEVHDGATTHVEFPAPAPLGCTLKGRVLRGGVGVPEARVSAMPTWKPERIRLGVTDAQGRFALEDVFPGPGVMITVRAPGESKAGSSASRTITVPDAPEHVVDFVLDGGGQIAGRVFLRTDGTALTALIQVHPVGVVNVTASEGGLVSSDAEGRYAVAQLEPGRYRVIAHVNDPSGPKDGNPDRTKVAPQSIEVDIGESGVATADFAIEFGGRAIVEVRAPDGSPVSKADARLRPAAKGAELVVPNGDRTNDDGIARIDGIPAGRYVATVTAAGFPTARSEPFTLDSGRETRVAVRLVAGTKIRVRLVDESGATLPINVVHAMDESGTPVGLGQAAKGATFVELAVPRGKVRLVVYGVHEPSGSTEIDAGDEPPPEVVVTRSSR